MSMVAHSQGTTATFYGMAKMPEFFQQHLNLFIALGPIAKMSKMEPSFAILGRLILDHLAFFKAIGYKNFLPFFKHSPVPSLCRALPSICLSAMHFLNTADTTQMDPTLVYQYLGHYPAGSSVNCGLHYA